MAAEARRAGDETPYIPGVIPIPIESMPGMAAGGGAPAPSVGIGAGGTPIISVGGGGVCAGGVDVRAASSTACCASEVTGPGAAGGV